VSKVALFGAAARVRESDTELKAGVGGDPRGSIVSSLPQPLNGLCEGGFGIGFGDLQDFAQPTVAGEYRV
jgi:hypothetical protein